MEIAQVHFAVLIGSGSGLFVRANLTKSFCCFNWLGFLCVFLRVRKSAKSFAVLTGSGFGLFGMQI